MTRVATIRRRPLLAAAFGLPLATAVPVARAQPAPPPLAGGRPIRVVVPFPPGGAIDILGRLLAERLSPALGGQAVVVENRAGAGGLLGADAVAKGSNDGSVLGVVGITTLAAFPYLYRSLPFDPARDFTPLTQITSGALLCVANAGTARTRGWTDFRALVAWARANPEGVRMGSSGTGTSSHLVVEAVNAATGARILHVPYRGGGPAITDLLAGTIDIMFDVTPALVPHVEAGRFVALAVSSGARTGFLPDVPGLAEFADLGLGELDVVTSNLLLLPANTPEPVVARLFAAVREAAASPGYAERLRPLGYDTVLSDSPAALAAMVERERPRWRRLVEISGARLD